MTKLLLLGLLLLFVGFIVEAGYSKSGNFFIEKFSSKHF